MSDKNTEQAQPRIVPTRAGWWWADMSKWHGVDTLPEPLEAYIEDGRATFDGMDDDELSEDQVTWLAPIPGPAVLAALAEWSEAVFAWEDAGGRKAPNGGRDMPESRLIVLAEEGVIAAIRAERDAERDGGA